MAEQSITRNWKGIATRSVTDTSTGKVRVFVIGLSPAPITGSTEVEVLRTKDGNNEWEYTLTGQRALLGYYNQNNTTQIDTQKLNELVFTDAIKQYNNDRAAILNNNDNYANATEAEDNRRFFAQTSRIPGVIDPVTNQKVAPDGKLIDPTSPPPPPPSDPDNDDDPPPGPGTGGSQPDPDTSNTQLTPISDLNQISGKATDSTFDTLRYPKTPAVDDKFDYLKIDVIKYVPPGLGTNANFNVKRFDERATNILGSVFLPMQPGITDSNGASWNEDRLNPFQAALGGTAAEALNDFGGGNIKGGVENFINNIKKTAGTLADSGNVQPYLTAYFAGQAVGANIIARQTGAVINNNLELLFNGPKLRTFQYNFRFTPREDDEAREIKKIIRVFKRNLAPSQTDDGLFLASPNVFRLKYIYGNSKDQHPFLNKIGTCALTDMSVNYTPDGTYMTYGDGSMTSYTMTLQFSELNPIYREDYDTTEGQQGMGY
jgi:hypothetical protein